MSELAKIAKAMVARGRGILAADESTGTIEKRFTSINVENTEENRRAYRELLFTTRGLGEHVSGVILYDETLRQKAADGTPFATVLSRQGVLPGIKVDAGTADLAFCPGEKVTEGLDKLAKRCQEYVKLGAKFAKWRAVITIGPNIPSTTCIAANAHALGRYAAICQATGLVPIVEPEVLMDGDHTIERCEEVTEWTLSARVPGALRQSRGARGERAQAVDGDLGQGLPRSRRGRTRSPRAPSRVLKRTVPAAVAGIAFLSGGQADEEATANLGTMNRMFPNLPWPLTFSYGRALQQPSLKAWKGAPGNVAQAQALLAHRARMNGLAATGEYRPDLEKKAA